MEVVYLSKTIYCGYCGNPISKNQAYCSYCGAKNTLSEPHISKQTIKKEKPTSRSNKKSKKKLNARVLVYVLAVFLFLSGAGAIYYYFPVSASRADSIIHKDWEQSGALDVTTSPSDSMALPDFITLLEERSSFTVISTENKDGLCTATCRITSCDLKSSLDTFMSEHGAESVDEGSIDELITKLISESELITTEAEVYICRDKLKYTVVYSDEFFDRMYSGIVSYYYDALGNDFNTDNYEETNNENK